MRTPHFFDFTLRVLRRDPVLAAVMTFFVGFGVALLWTALAMFGESSCKETPTSPRGMYVVQSVAVAMHDNAVTET